MGAVGTIALRCPRPYSGRNDWILACDLCERCAAPRGADGAARRPYPTALIRRCAWSPEEMAFPFGFMWLRMPGVKFSRAPLRYICAFILICAGASGILFSPSIGLLGGQEVRSFTMNSIQEFPWGAAISSSELEVPFVQNKRGLVFMNIFLAASLGAFFGGVHWYAALRSGIISRE